MQASVKAGKLFSIQPHITDIDVEGLTSDQKEMVFKLLTEEQDSFARDGNYIGCIKELELELDLVDHTPVQKNYIAVPKLLYPEVKAYIEDLLNQNSIGRSTSSYSSPVVCVRRKDQSLRLYVDFRALNKKTRPDRHPIHTYIYIHINGRKRQINYKFIPTSLFRGRPLIRGFNENKLYHRLYTI